MVIVDIIHVHDDELTQENDTNDRNDKMNDFDNNANNYITVHKIQILLIIFQVWNGRMYWLLKENK